MIRQATLAIVLPALAFPVFATTKKPPEPAAQTPDLAALIECRGTLQQFQTLKATLLDKHSSVAAGWTPLPEINPYMFEFSLPAPVGVFGNATAHIAFTSDSVIAVLDLPDPRPLAHRLQLETAIDTPQKAMFGKEVRGNEVTDDKGQKLYDSAVLNVSNVDTHPGKTLAGCSYDLDTIDDDAPAASSVAAPASGH